MFDGPLTAELGPGERRARLRLARSARIGPVTFHEALAHFGSAHAACARLDTTSDAAIAREEEALAKGMAEKAEEFVEKGAEVYAKA